MHVWQYRNSYCDVDSVQTVSRKNTLKQKVFKQINSSSNREVLEQCEVNE